MTVERLNPICPRQIVPRFVRGNYQCSFVHEWSSSNYPLRPSFGSATRQNRSHSFVDRKTIPSGQDIQHSTAFHARPLRTQPIQELSYKIACHHCTVSRGGSNIVNRPDLSSDSLSRQQQELGINSFSSHGLLRFSQPQRNGR